MPAIRVNFGEILLAIEDKLLADGVVPDRTNVSWAVNDDLPHLTMAYDVLLRARSGARIDMDGGSWDLRWSRLVDVFYRSQSIQDPGASNKSWVTETFIAVDRIFDSIGDTEFTPKNALGENLTISPIKPAGDIAPTRDTNRTTWGEWVCTLDVHYLPLVTPVNPLTP